MTQTLINSIIPSVIGFAVGYLTAVVVNYWTSNPDTRPRRVGVLQTLLGVMLIVGSTTIGVQNYQDRECYRDAQQASRDQSYTNRQVQKRFLDATIRKDDPAVIRASLVEYRESLDDLDRVVNENPYKC